MLRDLGGTEQMAADQGEGKQQWPLLARLSIVHEISIEFVFEGKSRRFLGEGVSEPQEIGATRSPSTAFARVCSDVRRWQG